jgi:hypothetical protein
LLQPPSTQRILAQLQPSLVLSGDMHESCYYEHGDAAAEAVPEWTVTTFNPLQGTQFPGFGVMSLYGAGSAGNATDRAHSHSHAHVRSGGVSFHHCFACPALYSAAGHGVAAAVLLSGGVLRRLRRLAVPAQRGARGDIC